jgi:ribonucleoside-triphosphate reductase
MNQLDVIKTVEEYLHQKDWRVKENSNVIYSIGGLYKYLTSKICAIYWLNKYYPEYIKKAHFNGDLHLHDLGELKPYTYKKDECILVKFDNTIKYISFNDLYDTLDSVEFLLNEEDQAYAKYPEKLFIFDKDGWVPLKRIVKKKSGRPMHFIKTTNGHAQIVTDNHPIVTSEGDIEAKDITKDNYLITKKLDIPEGTIYELDLCEILADVKGIKLNGGLDSLNGGSGQLSLANKAHFLNSRINLDKEFGWIYGILLAEGTYGGENVSFTNKDMDILKRASEWANTNNIAYTISKKNNVYNFTFRNKLFAKLLNKLSGGVKYSINRQLPNNFIEYNREFLTGVISGLIDGDGCIMSNGGISIRIISRYLLNQVAFILRHMGYTVREYTPQFNNMNKTGFKSNFTIYGIAFTPIEGVALFNSFKINKVGLSDKEGYDTSTYTFGYSDKARVLVNKEVVDFDEWIFDITTETGTFYCNEILSHNCNGIDLEAILNEGINGVYGHIESTPPKHFSSAIDMAGIMVVNLQAEFAGAQGLSNFDLLLAPFLKKDMDSGFITSYDEVKQAMQRFIFQLNYPLRQASEPPFSNITFDILVPEEWAEKFPLVGGKPTQYQYKDCQKEMDMINRAFCEVMLDGDAKGRGFPYPIPTYNITKGFNWDDSSYDKIFELAGKHGSPYFQNLINSDLKPSDLRSFCCRLQLSLKELAKKTGGLFGSNARTGSIGVVTINMPRLAYLSKSKEEFFQRLANLMDTSRDALEIKRKTINELMKTGLYPYISRYVYHFNTFFSTIGLVGGNEACINLLRCSISDPKGKEFMIEVLKFMKERLIKYQEETGNMYNLEATPAESVSYRFAKKDLELYSDIHTSKCDEYGPYYTNSTHLPVDYTEDPFLMLDHQDDLQKEYTGGSVNHLYLNESINDKEIVKKVVKKICTKYKLPYFTFSPTYSVCPVHGRLEGEHFECPKCDNELKELEQLLDNYNE